MNPDMPGDPVARGLALSPRIFKAYDVRGIVDDTLTEQAVWAIGSAFADLMRQRGVSVVVVGRDGRLSSLRLQQVLLRALSNGGAAVIDIGLCTSPMLYFATYHLRTGTGIQVTGSHNPPQYNGLKFMLAGDTLQGETIQELGRRAQAVAVAADVTADVVWPVLAGGATHAYAGGTVQAQSVVADYRQRIVGDVRLHRPVRVVIDAGNGVAGAYAGDILRALGCEVIELYCDVDGHFPNHHPDPSRSENLQDLLVCVASSDAELGLAFDGDADRLGVVTRWGNIIDADRLLMLFARDVLSRNPGAQILFDVKCSRLLGSLITACGGEPLMWKTGHSMLKAKLKETGAPLAGEMSGHFFFGERWYGFDDGIYAAARLLEIVSRHEEASAMLDALPSGVSTPEIQVPMAEGQSHLLVEKLSAQAQFEGALSISRVDGVRVDFCDGFGLVRASNTTPVLTLRFEADTPQRLVQIQTQFRDAINAVWPGIDWAG